MAKPILYFQNWDGTNFPSKQDESRWTEETESGTKLTGADDAKVGIYLGSLTNLSSSNEFNILLSHSAENPVTGVKFYFAPTTNDRTDGTGFTHDSGDNATQAQADFDELKDWGDNDPGQGDNYGINIRPTHSDTWISLKSGQLDELANATPLDNNYKFKDDASTAGDSPDGETDWIESFSNYVSNDSANVVLQLNIPDIDDAGIRQIGFVVRLVYSF